MDDHLLFAHDGPALTILGATPSQVCDLMLAWVPAHPEWAILRIRGEKSTDKSHFLDEFSAVLQFPYYFGYNWDAAWECITDLYWLKGSGFLIIFDSAQFLLSESDDDFRILLQVLTDAQERWHQETADFGADGHKPIAFQSILACDPDAVDALIARVRAAGATFTVL
jgi:RNAse (barnase) inhibitor barstar